MGLCDDQQSWWCYNNCESSSQCGGCEDSCESSCERGCQTTCERTYQCATGCQVSVQNRPPNRPNTISAPSSGKAGKPITITWSTATDLDGNMKDYELQRSVNNGAFTTIYVGTAATKQDTLQSTWSTAQYRVRSRDTKNATSSYTTSQIVSVVQNVPPVISGQDGNLGVVKSAFNIEFSVDDEDEGDTIMVTATLNNRQLSSVANAKRKEIMTIEITNEMLAELPLKASNNIEIKAVDSFSNVSYRRYTFTRGNAAPTITMDDDMGTKMEPFSFTFSAVDPEGDAMSASLILNGKRVHVWKAIDAESEITADVGKVNFARLPNGESKVELRVADEHGAEAKRLAKVNKSVDKLWYSFKREFGPEDGMPTVAAVSVMWNVAEGAVGRILVCNNAFDADPSWEDALTSVTNGLAYEFKNKTKTAEHWGFGLRVEIERNIATGTSWLMFIGGAVE